MTDIRSLLPDAAPPAEAPEATAHQVVRREDYRPPDWLVPDIALCFTLGLDDTRVQSKLVVERNGDHDRPLRLNGDEISPTGVWVDGVQTDNWSMDGDDLLIPLDGDRHDIGIETNINPAANTHLSGLYASNGMLCTQCEAQGFRRITFFPDRPDVLSRYRVRMAGDAAQFPVLLSNGNQVAGGTDEDGRHWAEWEDPWPKPCYLFALVAGDLVANRDRFATTSGREVDLAIWVRAADLAKTAHAMASLKAAMDWDERIYGREYDLDQFNIVAVSDFNMGAMENKSLNVFNTAYVLADPDTATDVDFDNIARVVAHEYFHNWSGNRVTCRDWFQLSLKEGFTVFRDQSFSADMGSAAAKRIEDVRVLRAAQFPEDDGPLAHPVRPDSYIEISNFYTATVYNKGAEVIRMMATVLGPDKFRAGTDLYFDRHDGEAATCDDFVKALEDASGIDLSAFRIWYSQAGTPRVRARMTRDPATGDAALKLSQRVPPTPGQPDKAPMPIPLKIALIGRNGEAIGEEQLIILADTEQTIPLDGAGDGALLSINRGFSAPVVLDVERAPGDLGALARFDTDPFARFEAMQDLMLNALLAGAKGAAPDFTAAVEAGAAILGDVALEDMLKAEALVAPGEALIADRLEAVDPDAVHASREALRHALGSALREPLLAAQARITTASDLSIDAKGTRRLRGVALGLIAAADSAVGAALAKAQFDAADNMTDRQAALAVLASLDAPEREVALDAFYARYHGNDLVIDKWFALQASAQRSDTLDRVIDLAAHPDFKLSNPNRLRALAGTFGYNHWAFHRADGRGYAFLADTIIAADALNPQTAARLVAPFGRWKRYEPKRSAMMRDALARIVAAPNLSKDVFEQASKSLA